MRCQRSVSSRPASFSKSFGVVCRHLEGWWPVQLTSSHPRSACCVMPYANRAGGGDRGGAAGQPAGGPHQAPLLPGAATPMPSARRPGPPPRCLCRPPRARPAHGPPGAAKAWGTQLHSSLCSPATAVGKHSLTAAFSPSRESRQTARCHRLSVASRPCSHAGCTRQGGALWVYQQGEAIGERRPLRPLLLLRGAVSLLPGSWTHKADAASSSSSRASSGEQVRDLLS